MYQVVTKKLDVGYIDHMQHYAFTFATSEEGTAGEPINTQNRSAAVEDLSVAQTSSAPSNNIVFRGRTMKALKASASGTSRYDEIYQIVIPRQRVITGVGDAVRALEQLR
jgi:hypothetical protein